MQMQVLTVKNSEKFVHQRVLLPILISINGIQKTWRISLFWMIYFMKNDFSAERTNAWIDAFKALLVRFETKARTWMSLHHIAFSLILIRVQTNHF